jgi:hypothetical protein
VGKRLGEIRGGLKAELKTRLSGPWQATDNGVGARWAAEVSKSRRSSKASNHGNPNHDQFSAGDGKSRAAWIYLAQRALWNKLLAIEYGVYDGSALYFFGLGRFAGSSWHFRYDSDCSVHIALTGG